MSCAEVPKAVQSIIWRIETDQELETCIETININFVRLNSNHSTVIANLKTSSNRFVIKMSYKVDTRSVRNVMPFYIQLCMGTAILSIQFIGNYNLKLPWQIFSINSNVNFPCDKQFSIWCFSAIMT